MFISNIMSTITVLNKQQYMGVFFHIKPPQIAAVPQTCIQGLRFMIAIILHPFLFLFRTEASQKGKARRSRRVPGSLDFGTLLTTSILFSMPFRTTHTNTFVALSLRTQARLSFTSLSPLFRTLLCASHRVAMQITCKKVTSADVKK